MPDGNNAVAPSPRGEYSLDNATRFGWGSVSGSLLPERTALLERLVIGPKVLDAGCGGGGYADYVAGLGFDVTGVDKYDFFLNQAGARNLRGTFVQADLCAGLPFPDKTFDTTYCIDVLEHVDDEAAIRELARVTRRRLIVAVPAEDQRASNYYLTYVPYLDQTHLRYYTADALRALLGTVRPARVEVAPEGRVPLEIMVRREFTVGSKYPLLAGLYKRAFRFLAARAIAPDWHVNWLGVADLTTEPAP